MFRMKRNGLQPNVVVWIVILAVVAACSVTMLLTRNAAINDSSVELADGTKPFVEFASAPVAAAKPVSSTVPRSSDAVSVTEDRKVVYSGSISAETTEFQSVCDQINSLVEISGGYFETNAVSSFRGDDGSGIFRFADFVICIPVGRLDSFMDSVEDMNVTVTSRGIYATDVSDDYHTIEAKLSSEQARLDRYGMLLEKTESVSDSILVESEIIDVQHQVDHMQGLLDDYGFNIKYSTVEVVLTEVPALIVPASAEPDSASDSVEGSVDYGTQFSDSLSEGFTSGVSFFKGLALDAARNWLLIAVCAGIILIALLIIGCVSAHAAKKDDEQHDGERHDSRDSSSQTTRAVPRGSTIIVNRRSDLKQDVEDSGVAFRPHFMRNMQDADSTNEGAVDGTAKK